ncbi:hypothetical protein [Agrobacterium tumefaciens]|uniref:hypothetical protein n=1 Tax=Agrobacterium tumefaciens TaxID=358 RepID=UPI000DD422C2|nr:hypothetical protein FY143_24745 [Agrobacterium tumefaciens]
MAIPTIDLADKLGFSAEKPANTSQSFVAQVHGASILLVADRASVGPLDRFQTDGIFIEADSTICFLDPAFAYGVRQVTRNSTAVDNDNNRQEVSDTK